jgi:ElaB/YqjD/DUF883 family membrane-anchored ribosome-binding protein
MAERTEPIRQDIEATRASMTETLEQIEGQVRDKVDTTVSQAKRAVDVRHQVNERPWLALGAAVTIGYLLGSMGGDDDQQPARPRPGEPMRYYTTEGSSKDAERRGEYQAQQVRHMQHPQQTQSYEAQHYEGRGYAGQPGRGRQMGGAVAQIVDPLRHEIGLIASAAVRSGMRALRESLRESIPQFESEYQAAQREREERESGEEGLAREVGGANPGPYTSTGSTPGTYTGSTPGSTPGTYPGSTPGAPTSTGSTPGTYPSTGSGTSSTQTSTGNTPGARNDDPFRPR